MSTQPALLTRRPARLAPAVVLALLAALAGTVGAWTLGAYAIDGAWPAQAADALAAGASARFDDLAVQAAAVVVALVGLAFVIAAVIPGDPGHRALRVDDTPGQTALSRRDLARRLRRHVAQVDAVREARVSIRRRRADVLVRTPIQDTAQVLARTRSAVDTALAELRPARDLRARVRVRRDR